MNDNRRDFASAYQFQLWFENQPNWWSHNVDHRECGSIHWAHFLTTSGLLLSCLTKDFSYFSRNLLCPIDARILPYLPAQLDWSLLGNNCVGTLITWIGICYLLISCLRQERVPFLCPWSCAISLSKAMIQTLLYKLLLTWGLLARWQKSSIARLRRCQ